MIRRPPRSTLDRSSAASDVYKRQRDDAAHFAAGVWNNADCSRRTDAAAAMNRIEQIDIYTPVSYTHLRAHETVLDLVCRLLFEKKKKNK